MIVSIPVSIRRFTAAVVRSRVRPVVCAMVCASAPVTGQPHDIGHIPTTDGGVLLIIPHELDGVTMWLAHGPRSTHAGWSADFDPDLAVRWIGDARAVVAYDGAVDAPLIMSPTLPAIHGGMVTVLRRAQEGRWGPAEFVYQSQPDHDAIATSIGDASGLLDQLETQAVRSRWFPRAPRDSLRPLPITSPHLERAPEPIGRPMLAYPSQLGDGAACLEFVIGTDGRVLPATIRMLYATSSVFAESARRIVSVSRFEPGTVQGVPVPVRMLRMVSFEDRGTP